MSEWAPLCIGPYSQANGILDCLLFTAGQIALNPSTMTLLASSSSPQQSVSDVFYAQLTLACRHVARVLQVLNSSLHRVMCCTVLVNIGVLNSGNSNSTLEGSMNKLEWNDWENVKEFVQELISKNSFDNEKKSENDDDNEDNGDEDDGQSECSEKSLKDVREYLSMLWFLLIY